MKSFGSLLSQPQYDIKVSTVHQPLRGRGISQRNSQLLTCTPGNFPRERGRCNENEEILFYHQVAIVIKTVTRNY